MSRGPRQIVLSAMDAQSHGFGTLVLRAALRVLSFPYSLVIRARNRLYDAGFFPARSLGVPVISIGNITTGGTGKTPVAIWLARAMQQAGQHPAVLLRGYKGTGGQSDEAKLLAESLPGVPVVANPVRAEGAAHARKSDMSIDLLILDDGFQHRKVQREFDLVLISATQPFGHGYLLPRGLSREPLAGLSRASAFLITHVSQVSADTLTSIESRLRDFSQAPIFHADHAQSSLLSPSGGAVPWETVSKYAICCGIGDPESYIDALTTRLGKPVMVFRFPDHYSYTADDVTRMQKDMAYPILVTEKDWVKLSQLKNIEPFLRVQMAIDFRNDEGSALLSLILPKVHR